MGERARPVNTFSIVARDPANGDLGVAVASKFLAVGAVVPWARAGVGAVATQAGANVSFGPRGLELLAGGASTDEALATLRQADEGREERQVGLVDATGRAATFTGRECMEWAGGISGADFCCQGNILAGAEVVRAMAAAYRATTARFPERLLAALEAGQCAGGDRRGQQSAALLVVRERGGYGGRNDRFLDLRVDDHPQPLVELARLAALHRVYFATDDAELVPFDAELRTRIAGQLVALGEVAPGASEADVAAGLARFAGRENLEERLREDGSIDTVLLRFLAERVAAAAKEGGEV